jgi:hypothetical protein
MVSLQRRASSKPVIADRSSSFSFYAPAPNVAANRRSVSRIRDVVATLVLIVGGIRYWSPTAHEFARSDSADLPSHSSVETEGILVFLMRHNIGWATSIAARCSCITSWPIIPYYRLPRDPPEHVQADWTGRRRRSASSEWQRGHFRNCPVAPRSSQADSPTRRQRPLAPHRMG